MKIPVQMKCKPMEEEEVEQQVDEALFDDISEDDEEGEEDIHQALSRGGVEYFQRLAHQYRLLSFEEEQTLGLRVYEHNDQDARNKLVCHNLRLVLSFIARHFDTRLSTEDRIQLGVLGLMRAADKFDPTRGFRFATYASWWIWQSLVRDSPDEGSTIRIPTNHHQHANRALRAGEKLHQKLKRTPTFEEIAGSLELSVEEV